MDCHSVQGGANLSYHQNLYGGGKTRVPTWKLLSDSDIAEKSIAQIKKNRVVRTLKSRRGNVGGGITRGLRKHSRTSDTFLRQ